jgi:hypothetical protein
MIRLKMAMWFSRIEVQNTAFLEKDGNLYNFPEASLQQHFVYNGPNHDCS